MFPCLLQAEDRAAFSPHIHGTWGPPFRPPLYMSPVGIYISEIAIVLNRDSAVYHQHSTKYWALGCVPSVDYANVFCTGPEIITCYGLRETG